MQPAEFRRQAHLLADWIADYLEGSERYPVLSQVRPGAIRAQLPAAPPATGETMEAIWEDFQRILMPGLTHWNHPAFFAYFSISASPPGVLAEFLSAALNQQAMLWRTSPAATELEQVTLSWLRDLIGLPQPFEGVIYDTASISTLHALAAARERLGRDIRVRGLSGQPPITVYCSQDAHSSVDKAVLLLGLGHDWLRKIPIDESFRMRPDLLQEAIDRDRAAGCLPMAVVATAGTTSTSSVDPIPAVADIVRREGLWLHVDAAYAGPAAICPEYRWIVEGAERADSLTLNPHKWLFVPFDLSVLYVRDLHTLKAAFSLIPEYLRTEEETLNLMDTGIQLGRRFRSLKLWFIMRSYGVEGLQAMIRQACQLARHFARRVEEHPHFELLAPVPLSLVCFRACPPGVVDLDTLNEELMRTLNTSGEAFLSHTRLDGKLALRLAVGHMSTRRQHIDRVFELLEGYLAARGNSGSHSTQQRSLSQ
ncbi:amino acid decarboxylase [bacterium CPR1]|nr:amino acid decarboxylase [bacterium CPR1]